MIASRSPESQPPGLPHVQPTRDGTGLLTPIVTRKPLTASGPGSRGDAGAETDYPSRPPRKLRPTGKSGEALRAVASALESLLELSGVGRVHLPGKNLIRFDLPAIICLVVVIRPIEVGHAHRTTSI